MKEIRITVHGNVVGDPVARTDRKGETYSTFRIASTPSRRGADGLWRDMETTYYSVIAFRALGGNVATSLRKGQPVMVEGTVSQKAYVDKDGNPRQSLEIVADHVGHDLTFGRATFLRMNKGTAQGYDRTYDPDIRDVMEGLNDVGEPARPANVDRDGVVLDVALDSAGMPLVDALLADYGDPDTDDYEVEQPAA